MHNGAGSDGEPDRGRLVVGRYRLLEVLGRGGMGTVWRAEDELLGRHVALKRLRVPPQSADDERERLYERTRREARSAARIAHPNVVVVHDVVDDDGLPCIVMEYVPARNLGDVLKEGGPVSPREAARIGQAMIAALRAAHAAGVVHRDVKPGNVLLGEDGRVVLTDFGIAVASDTSTLTRTGELFGSVDYVAPERFRGAKPGPASDLWSLGATLYQAVEGRAPFRRDTAIETAYSIATDPLTPPSGAGPLARLIEQLLAKDPDARPTAEAVERLLRRTPQAGEPDADRAEPLAPDPDHAEPPRAAGGRGSEGPVTGATPTAVIASGASPATAVPGRDDGLGPSGGSDRSARPERADRPDPPGPMGATADPVGSGGSRGRRRVAVWAVTLVVIAVAAISAVVALRGPGDGKRSGGSSGTPSATAPARHGPSPVPEGYHLVKEEAVGLGVPVPDGWARKRLSDGTIAFIEPGGLVGLRVDNADFAGSDPLRHWKADEVESLQEGKLPGYKRLRMHSTKYRGQPAAIWEFTFEGRARQFRAVDLGFGRTGENGYTIYLSAPSADWAEYRPVFDNVRAGLRVYGGL